MMHYLLHNYGTGQSCMSSGDSLNVSDSIRKDTGDGFDQTQNTIITL